MDGRVAWPCGMIQRIQSFQAELVVIFISANDIKQIFGLDLVLVLVLVLALVLVLVLVMALVLVLVYL